MSYALVGERPAGSIIGDVQRQRAPNYSISGIWRRGRDWNPLSKSLNLNNNEFLLFKWSLS
ncbi:hypothetical protein HYPGJ_31026 [Hyphomicrobium sp. GJ21]|nr:hypothetical protein HYPGJ_31026 [Hyphomicrobium sp. GJ21]